MTVTLDAIEAAGKDIARLHDLYAEALTLPYGGPRDVALAALRNRLTWPLPDTPEDEVLRGAGTPGCPLARVLAAEQARPARYRRPALIAELRDRAGQPVTEPADPDLEAPRPKGLWR